MAFCAPIELPESSAANKCNSRCSLLYDYPTTTLQYEFKNEYLKIKPDSNSESVTFDSVKYSVKEARVYSSALHKYPNSNDNIGELVIEHNSTSGGKTLIICIPIKLQSLDAGPTTPLDKIMKFATTDSGTIDIPNFGLNKLIPKTLRETVNGGYYTYKGPPLDSCVATSTIDYIVFDIDKTNCPKISQPTYDKLQSTLTESDFDTKPAGDEQTVSYSTTPPSNTPLGDADEIYIQCTPTDATSTSEETLVAADTPYNLDGLKWTFNWNDVMNHPALLFIIGILMMALFMYICKKIINMISVLGEKMGSFKIS